MVVTHEVLQFQLKCNNSSDDVLDKIEKLLMRYGLQDRIIEAFRSSTKPILMLIAACSRFTVEVYQDGLVCLDAVQSRENPLIKDFSGLEEEIRQVINATSPQQNFLMLKGAAPDFLYFMIGDVEIEQFKFTRQLYSAHSPYQQIDIYHSDEYGAMLFLDYNTNIADSDVIYTKTLTGNGKYNMTNCKILILGGGDGAALKEVLNCNPNMVIMIEIDKMVIDAARQHMRNVCGNVLDNLKGDSYEIIINDCIPVMREFIEKEEQFDYILYDLTEIPIDTTGKEWEQLMHTIMDLSMKLLSPKGVCIAQGHKTICGKSSDLFVQQLKCLHCPVMFSKESVFIPSYRQKWTFYTIWKK